MTEPHAARATAEANALVDEHRATLRPLIDAWGKARTAIQDTDDVLEMLSALGDLTLATEALANTAASLHTAQRAWLAACMADTGATTVRGDHGTWSVKAKASFVDVIDSAAVPPELMTAPIPQPDKKRIREHIENHPVNWARIVPGSGWTAAFKPRSK